MTNATLTRRSFSKLIGLGAGYVAVGPLAPVLADYTTSATSVVRLSSNENPYGPSPAALKAMTEGFSLAWRYPDEYGDMLAGS